MLSCIYVKWALRDRLATNFQYKLCCSEGADLKSSEMEIVMLRMVWNRSGTKIEATAVNFEPSSPMLRQASNNQVY